MDRHARARGAPAASSASHAPSAPSVPSASASARPPLRGVFVGAAVGMVALLFTMMSLPRSDASVSPTLDVVALPPPAARADAATPPAPAADAVVVTPAAPVVKASKYEQPPSVKHVWFDVEALGGFREVPLIEGALTPTASMHDRWIVVTTINPPTPTIEKLAALPGWRVVIVGDTKTPSDWAWPNCTFLPVPAQLELGFSTTPLLRTRSYQRKNIGYLYAILHGAQVIYETDDDNALTKPEVTLIATEARRLGDATPQGQQQQHLAPAPRAAAPTPLPYAPRLVSTTGGAFGRGSGRVLEFAPSLDPQPLGINHHAHFGQPSTWPRGYPLEDIALPHLAAVREVTLTPAVQQGLADGDPDMDAIFRLTRKPSDTRVDFSFDQVPPIAMPFGSFGPFNAQNTVFTYEGLWATALPQTVEFRVCDIWRAYYVQRLLWGTGGNLVFVAPYVYQMRNAHSYHDDYISEAQIYDQVTRFLSFLRDWRCPVDAPGVVGGTGRDSRLPGCAVALARDTATGGFWGPADAELMRHYFHDLQRVGYVFPAWTELDVEAPSSDGGPPSRFVRPCAARAAGCAARGDAWQEELHSSLPAIELYGTCTKELPPQAVLPLV